jgi:hypothetical protein
MIKYILLLSYLFTVGRSQTACDDEMMIIKNELGKFQTKAFNPPILTELWPRLHSVTAGIEAAFQLCLNKPFIINPYSPNSANCLIGLTLTSKLSEKYSKIIPGKGEVQNLSDIVIQAETDCEEILNQKSEKSLSSDCQKNILGLNDSLTKYTDARILGKEGKEFLAEIAIAIDKQRRICDFPPTNKPEISKDDNCKSANDWLGFIAEQIESILDKKNFNIYSKYYKFIYHSAMRAIRLCNSGNLAFLEIE